MASTLDLVIHDTIVVNMGKSLLAYDSTIHVVNTWCVRCFTNIFMYMWLHDKYHVIRLEGKSLHNTHLGSLVMASVSRALVDMAS